MSLSGCVPFGTSSIRYIISYSSRRTRAGISVSPDKTVEVTVPEQTPPEKVQEIVLRKAPWIFEQMEWFDHLMQIDNEKEYVRGETFLYLGRQYRLKIVCNGPEPDVKLRGGYFEVIIPENSGTENQRTLVRDSLLRWYSDHAHVKVEEILRKYAKKMGLEPPQYTIKNQLKRWGSCTKDGMVNINVRIAMAPISQIEYVVAHELCHLKYRNHSAPFWNLLRRVMPDYEIRKDQLLKDGWRYVL